MKQNLNEVMIVCSCGRSASGYCDGSHSLSREAFDKLVNDELAEAIAPPEPQVLLG